MHPIVTAFLRYMRLLHAPKPDGLAYADWIAMISAAQDALYELDYQA